MWRESKQVINIFSLVLYFFPLKSVFLPLWKCISSFLKLYFWCVLVEGLQVINCRCTGNGSIGRISPRYWTSIYPNIRNTSFQRISPRYWTSIRNTSFQRIQPRYWTRRASIPSSKTQVFNTFDHWSSIQLHISSSTCNIIPHIYIASIVLPWYWTHLSVTSFQHVSPLIIILIISPQYSIVFESQHIW